MQRRTEQEQKQPLAKEGEEKNDGEGKNDAGAETRSAPGDLLQQFASDSEAAGSGNETEEDGEEVKKQKRKRQRKRRLPYQKHQRNAPGFTSGPPWPRAPHTEAPWARLIQERQQHALIEKEINVLAAESQCGMGKWRPAWLQRFATRHWLLLWLCWYCAVQGLIVNGLVPSSISTIERRFKLSSSTIGRIIQCYDFGYVLLCIPVSYFGGRHSKPLVLALGLICMSLGSFVFSWPHLFSGSYVAGDASEISYGQCGVGGIDSPTVFSPVEDVQFPSNESLLSSPTRPPPLKSMALAASLRGCPSPENQPGSFRFVFLFCFAHLLHGIGATPLFTIGVSYIDENVGPALSSLFLGIFYAFAIFGPAVGFLAAGNFLQYHTDFLHMPPELMKGVKDLTETDPRWVGAWWLGFQIASVIGLLAVLPILILPKVLPESLKWHRTRLREETLTGSTKKRTPECCGMPSTAKTAALCTSTSTLHIDDKVVSHALADSMPAVTGPRKGPLWYQLWLDVRHIPIAIYRILTNGSYMLITVAVAVDGLVVTGASSFMSKYLERQFSVAPSKANVLIGCVMVPMAGVGTMMSGFIVQHFRLSCAQTLKFSMLLLVVSVMLTPMYLIYCDHDPLVGAEVHYPGSVDEAWSLNDSSHLPTLLSECNSGCDCVESEYQPVCAELLSGKQISFYSPCYAGCPEKYEPQKKFYSNCSCAPTNTKRGYRMVKRGFCESKCTGLFAFLALFAPLSFCTFAIGVPLIIVVLRTVDYAERSFALGIQWILVRVIGTIPAPVLFGWMFDVSCTQQQKDACSGEDGSCMLYKNKRLAELFLTFSVVGQMIALVLLLCVLLFFASSMRDDPLPDAEEAETAREEVDDEGVEKEREARENDESRQENDEGLPMTSLKALETDALMA